MLASSAGGWEVGRLQISYFYRQLPAERPWHCRGVKWMGRPADSMVPPRSRLNSHVSTFSLLPGQRGYSELAWVLRRVPDPMHRQGSLEAEVEEMYRALDRLRELVDRIASA